jgi:NCS1 family nucleobase:cation symporter-1
MGALLEGSMTDAGATNVATPQDDSRLALELHGYDFIPESERYLTLQKLFLFWVGANAYLIFFTYGTTAIILGLSLWQALVVIVIGNVFWWIVALGSIGGPRSGLPTMTFSRAPFGVLGNRINSFLAWIVALGFEALNTLLGAFGLIALFGELGWKNSAGPGKILATVIVLSLSIVIAVIGHSLMVYAQQFFAVALTAALVLVFFYTVGNVNWSAGQATPLSTGETFGVMLIAMAIVVSGPLSYLFNCADYSRYLPSKTPSRPIFWTVYAGSGGIVLFLCVLGAILATQTDLTDPVGGVKPLVPTWLFIVFIIAAVGGAISNNIVTFYSSGLTLQSLGIPLLRWKATLVDSVIATATVLYVLFVSDYTSYILDFLSFLNIWIGPFGAIWIVDGLLRRWRYDAGDIHSTAPSGRYHYRSGFNIKGLAALAAGMAVGALTINAPVFEGYLSRTLLWDGDLGWLLPWVISGALYYVLTARDVRAQAELPSSGLENALLPEAAVD